MITETTAKPSVLQRAFHELKELVFITLYLYVTLGAVILTKTAVLHTQGVQFTPWGIAIVKAVVLAKFMLLGEAMKVGERRAQDSRVCRYHLDQCAHLRNTLRMAGAYLGVAPRE